MHRTAPLQLQPALRPTKGRRVVFGRVVPPAPHSFGHLSQSANRLLFSEFCARIENKPFRESLHGKIPFERIALGSTPSLAALLEAAEHGSKPAADALFSALYSELRRLAKYELARHGAPMSLSATTLLHKAYIEIATRDRTSFADRNKFMGYAARVMRGLIIDHARSRRAQKRGGQFEITSLGVEIEDAADDKTLARISEALDELAKAEPALAEIVDLKFFCGFSFAEIAAMKDVCERTVQRQWEKARIYLHRSVRTDLEM